MDSTTFDLLLTATVATFWLLVIGAPAFLAARRVWRWKENLRINFEGHYALTHAHDERRKEEYLELRRDIGVLQRKVGKHPWGGEIVIDGNALTAAVASGLKGDAK